MKLPKSFIKKYGITKKAWSVFRETKKTNTRRVSNVAKKKHYSKGSKGSSMQDVAIQGVVGAGYGMIRPYAVNLIPDVAGPYTDNMALGGAGALMAIMGKGQIRKAGLTIVGIETFVVASKFNSGVNTSSSSGQVYG